MVMMLLLLLLLQMMMMMMLIATPDLDDARAIVYRKVIACTLPFVPLKMLLVISAAAVMAKQLHNNG